MISGVLGELRDAIESAVPCSLTPYDPRPPGLHAWLDAPTLIADEGVLCGEPIDGIPDMTVALQLRGSGPDSAAALILYDTLLVVLAAVPDMWWLSEDVTAQAYVDGAPYGYTVQLTTRRP